MLTVTIAINGQVIFARSAVNTGRVSDGDTAYKNDDGKTVWHNPEDGAIVLATKLLGTIKEQKSKKKQASKSKRPVTYRDAWKEN